MQCPMTQESGQRQKVNALPFLSAHCQDRSVQFTCDESVSHHSSTNRHQPIEAALSCFGGESEGLSMLSSNSAEVELWDSFLSSVIETRHLTPTSASRWFPLVPLDLSGQLDRHKNAVSPVLSYSKESGADRSSESSYCISCSISRTSPTYTASEFNSMILCGSSSYQPGDKCRHRPDESLENNDNSHEFVCVSNHPMNELESLESSLEQATTVFRYAKIQTPVERVNMVLLCFVALAATQNTQDCFLPSPDMSHMDVQLKPIAEVENAQFVFLRFRSTHWVGVVSKMASRSNRRLQVLDWVHRRKQTGTKQRSFVLSAVSYGALFENRSYHSSLADSQESIETSTPPPSPCWESINTATARYRDCHAVLCVFSGEAIGIAPCQRIHEQRLFPLHTINETALSHKSTQRLVSKEASRHRFDTEGAIRDWLYVVQPSCLPTMSIC